MTVEPTTVVYLVMLINGYTKEAVSILAHKDSMKVLTTNVKLVTKPV